MQSKQLIQIAIDEIECIDNEDETIPMKLVTPRQVLQIKKQRTLAIRSARHPLVLFPH